MFEGTLMGTYQVVKNEEFRVNSSGALLIEKREKNWRICAGEGPFMKNKFVLRDLLECFFLWQSRFHVIH